MSNEDRRCETCAACATIKSGETYNDRLECRKHAPLATHGITHAHWPTVQPKNWCLEWTPRQ